MKKYVVRLNYSTFVEMEVETYSEDNAVLLAQEFMSTGDIMYNLQLQETEVECLS